MPDILEDNDLCPFGRSGCCYLVRHCEEVGDHSYLGDDRVACVFPGFCPCPRLLEHCSQELGCRGFLLSLRGSTLSTALSQARLEGRTFADPLRCRGPDMAPKRRSQVACGFAQSTHDHRRATTSCRFAIGIPLGLAVEAEECTEEKVPFVIG
jgi:hypothetical protein